MTRMGSPHRTPPEVTTSALAARLQVDRKTLRRAVLVASATPPAARNARQRALARARPTPGGQLRWTAADAEAVAAAYERAPSDAPTIGQTPPDAMVVRRTAPTATHPYAQYEIACAHERATFDHNPTSGYAAGACRRCRRAWHVEGDVLHMKPMTPDEQEETLR